VRAPRWLAAAAVFASSACAQAPTAAPPPRPAPPRAHTSGVRCGTLWDPQVGTVADARIVFDGDRVARVGPATTTPAASDELDLRPLFCMPGLVDAHTHLTSYAHESAADGIDRRRAEATRNAELTLRAGVTSVRDLGGIEGVDLWLRTRIAAGAAAGPRMQCAGGQIGIGGTVGGPAGARAAVDAHADAGFDVIKLFATGGAEDPVPLLSVEELSAATAEAHGRGLRVAVHAIASDGINRSIAARVDSIEHATQLDANQAAAMAAAGIALVPTLYILRYYVEDADHLGFSAAYVADLQRMIDTVVVPYEARFKAILATGVRVAMGSDAFMAMHGKNPRELAYLVAAGMTPEQALVGATATAAEVMGWKGKVGTLAAGAYADLVATSQDPRKDVRALENVAVVLAGGRVVRDDRH
jgi:imidazolonepropionase-like amidohydrolase